ncbi:MAG: hypothetical protein AAGE52_00765 [Myxococcota bacterium]
MNTDALVASLLGPSALEICDVEGRPLGEVSARGYKNAARDEAHRDYGDARDHARLPSNLAALRQLQGCWPTLGTLLSSYEADRPATMGRVARRADWATRQAPLASLACSAGLGAASIATGSVATSEASNDVVLGAVLGAPSGLHTCSGEGRTSLDSPARPPVLLAALYKVCVGFHELATTMLLEGAIDADDPVPTTEDFLRWLEPAGAPSWLVGGAQVCAGTLAQIARIWEALCESGNEARHDDAAPLCRELEALIAAAAGAAREQQLRGEECPSLARALLESNRVPRVTESLRRIPTAGLVHPALLFEANEVPASLQGFAADVARGTPIDVALLEHARLPATRLAMLLGAQPTPITAAAFWAARED